MYGHATPIQIWPQIWQENKQKKKHTIVSINNDCEKNKFFFQKLALLIDWQIAYIV